MRTYNPSIILYVQNNLHRHGKTRNKIKGTDFIDHHNRRAEEPMAHTKKKLLKKLYKEKKNIELYYL